MYLFFLRLYLLIFSLSFTWTHYWCKLSPEEWREIDFYDNYRTPFSIFFFFEVKLIYVHSPSLPVIFSYSEGFKGQTA